MKIRNTISKKRPKTDDLFKSLLSTDQIQEMKELSKTMGSKPALQENIDSDIAVDEYLESLNTLK